MTGIVIVGAGMAGARACINLRAADYQGPITLIGEEVHLPYDRPPLSKASIVEEAEPSPIWLLEPDIVASLKVETKLGVPVKSIDRAPSRWCSMMDGAFPMTKLVLATGAKPRRLPGAGGEHALTLRDHQDTIELRRRFVAGQRVVVIGGGFIGLELASSAIKRGCVVSLIEMQPRILMRGVPESIATIVHQRHVDAGVQMLTGVTISSISANAVALGDGRVIKADTIIAGIGAAPEIRLAQEAGLVIENGIACNDRMQTSDPDIYAAGDCCSFPHDLFDGRRLRLESWRSAQEQAASAVQNLLGAGRPHVAVPWFWSDQYELSLQIAGMPDIGSKIVMRKPASDVLVNFHLADDGTLVGVSGIGPGNTIARDVKLGEMMIARRAKPDPAILADPQQPLKNLARG